MSMVERLPAARPVNKEKILEQNLSELGSQLDDARAEWAEISSRRQNRMFERRIHGYNDAKQRYDQLVVAYGRQSLSEDLSTADDDSERRILAVAYVIDQQNALRELTDQTVENKLSRKIGKVAGTWLQSGSKKALLAKSVAVGAAATLVGGAIGVGVALPLAVKFAKGYVTSEVKGLGRIDMATDDLLGDNDESATWTFDELIERAQERSSERFDIDGKEQQSQRRSAAKRGLGVVATGMALGGVIGMAVHELSMPSASAAAPNDNYVNPGLSNGAENPGLAEQSYVSPGLESIDSQDYVSPGIYQPDTTEYVSPGIFEADTDSYVNPGLADQDGAVNPGVSTAEDSYVSPGLADTDNYVSPDIAENDTYVSPGLADEQPETTPEPVPETDGAEQLGTFTVEYGNGYTHELIDAAAANGVEMTPEQAFEAHQMIVDQVGADYIDLTDHTGPDTYSMGDSAYETGISSPGEATWSPESIHMVNDAIDNGEIDHSYEGTGGSGDSVNPGVDESQTEAPSDESEAREARIIERSGLEGLEQASEDNADWSDLQADMSQMEEDIRSGNLDAVNNSDDYQNTLSYIARDGGGIEYPNSDVKIIAWDDAAERWMVNPIPEGSFIPERAIDLIGDYQRSLYRLAA